MIKRIKNKYRIEVLYFARFQAVVLGIVGFLVGVLYSFGGLIIDVFVSLGWSFEPSTPGLGVGSLFAFGALIGMPLFFAFVGFLTGVFEAFIYNLFSNWLGGIKMDFIHRID